jgi:putative ABC transport system permease protein
MFMFLEAISAALNAIRAHSFRSFLTALGIIIGVASVIAVVSIVQGLSYTVNAQFQGLGSNSITVRSFTPFRQALQGRLAQLTEDDLRAIEHRVEGISHITPILFDPQGRASLVGYRSQTTFTQVFGVGASWIDVQGLYPQSGRYFSRSDDQSRRMVCLVGSDVVENLELPDPPEGHFVRLGSEWCKIVGVMESRGELLGFSQDDYVLMPYPSMQRFIGGASELDIRIQFLVDDMARLDEIKDRVRRVLRQEHDLAAGDADDFRVQTPEQLAAGFNAIIDTITAVSGGIVGISLLVGGIGIMNIMLVSVTERTREIGILKALGAKKGDILMQFLIEAIAICMMGGVVGIAIGYGIGAFVSAVLPGFPPAHVPLWAVTLSFGFSMAVGVVFGIIPAAKAANLDPIDSLRYE